MGRFKSKSNTTLFRYLGNGCLLLGYYFLLFVNPIIGLIIRIIAPIFFIPSCIELKLYDILFLTGVFLFMDITKLIQLIFHK